MEDAGQVPWKGTTGQKKEAIRRKHLNRDLLSQSLSVVIPAKESLECCDTPERMRGTKRPIYRRKSEAV
jgi:hypothetical protein